MGADAEGRVMFVVMRLATPDVGVTIDGQDITLKRSPELPEGIVGYLAVYESLEAAEAEANGVQVLKVEFVSKPSPTARLPKGAP